jgi:hypothetical protein
MVMGTDDAVIPLTPAPLAGRVPPAFPEPLRPRHPLAGLPCPILRRLSSPRVAALGHPALGLACSGGAAVLPWARGKSRGRDAFTGGCGWGCNAGVMTQKCHVFFLSPITRDKTTLRPMYGRSSDFFGVVVLWDQNRS